MAIALPLDQERSALLADISSAAARAAKAEPGDRSDIIRFEALSAQFESWAFQQLSKDEVVVAPLADMPNVVIPIGGEKEALPMPTWVPSPIRQSVADIVSAGGALLALALPLEPGLLTPRVEGLDPPAPAKVWRSEDDNKGAAAVRERFEEQLRRAVEPHRADAPKPISPSGIQNKVLTDAFREYVVQVDGSQQVDVPVEYRDGSRARNLFSLRSLVFLSRPEQPPQLRLSFSLLSIRHAELDVIVDGAWLRNLQISQNRTAAETDDLVYAISRDQLTALTLSGTRRVLIRMYQTGLETAIVGFYRAVANHLLAHPGSLTVIPMFFASGKGQASYDDGPMWTTAARSGS